MSRIGYKPIDLVTLSISLGIAFIPLCLVWTSIEMSLVLSFFSVSGLIAAVLPRYIAKNNALIISALVFFTLFFVVAPVVQLAYSPSVLVNTMLLDAETASYANLYVAFFLLVFIISTEFFLKKVRCQPITIATSNDKISISALVLVSACISIYAFLDMSASSALIQTETDPTSQALKYKIIYFIPFFAISILLQTNLKSSKKLIVFVILLLCVFATKNYLTERRNAIGPVYLSIIALAFPVIVRKGRLFFYFILSVMVVAFPASSLLTHAKRGEEISLSYSAVTDAILKHFLELHYDAWANFVATIEMVNKSGHTMGGQLIGSVFFFIPRSLWESKPYPTGVMIGDYLSGKYQMWFNNLSAPIVAEGYLDFGAIGIVFFAIATSYFCIKIKALSLTGNYLHFTLYVYASFFLFFILRGALLPATVYFFGAVATIYLVPIFMRRYRFNYKSAHLLAGFTRKHK
ncbi:hypothetical protein [Pseudomonas sp. VI4.1]|uniref:hypothetical protein n=1 Tax=Pseudomonas sp. VI4.1 TaxID=1941346 RepID=UPI0009C8F156|nr:hypothetical protein [Pseudomonas sp. VI4.1]OPK10878.1 hypothetical protein BZ163_07670 [Pseudomonas sp. VI4.1]